MTSIAAASLPSRNWGSGSSHHNCLGNNDKSFHCQKWKPISAVIARGVTQYVPLDGSCGLDQAVSAFRARGEAICGLREGGNNRVDKQRRILENHLVSLETRIADLQNAHALLTHRIEQFSKLSRTEASPVSEPTATGCAAANSRDGVLLHWCQRDIERREESQGVALSSGMSTRGDTDCALLSNISGTSRSNQSNARVNAYPALDVMTREKARDAQSIHNGIIL
jgi:hypothetical protein